MDAVLRERLAARHVVTAAEILALGHDRSALRRMVTDGSLHRAHRGVYVEGAVWRAAAPGQRHLLRGRAALLRTGRAVLSHVTAVIAHGLPVHDAALDVVHLTRTGPGGSVRRGTVHLHPRLVPTAVGRTAEGLPACRPAVAALQTADWSGLEAGLVAAEAALWRRMIGPGDLDAARELVRLGRGRGAADRVVRLASDASESPGETLTRLRLLALAPPDPRQQVRIPTSIGLARVDFLLSPPGVVVEFDGAVKYEGAGGRAALVREKVREDALRRAGHEVVRVTWPDVRRAGGVRRIVAPALDAARRRGD